jgi:hypothetical protein
MNERKTPYNNTLTEVLTMKKSILFCLCIVLCLSFKGFSQETKNAFNIYRRIGVWSPTVTDIYINKNPVGFLDAGKTGFGYVTLKTKYIIPFVIRFKSLGFDIELSVDESNYLNYLSEDDTTALHFHIGVEKFNNIVITKEQELKSYSIEYAYKLLNNNEKSSRLGYAIEIIGAIGKEEDLKILLKYLKDNNHPYLQACSALSIGKIFENNNYKFDKKIFNCILEVFKNYSRNESYGWMFQQALDKLKMNKNGTD